MAERPVRVLALAVDPTGASRLGAAQDRGGEPLAEMILDLAAAYLHGGLALAVPFLSWGIDRVEPNARRLRVPALAGARHCTDPAVGDL